ncbi:MAG TPA: DUF547 domain-containing protein [Planctomycetes bacterium]|nr:DUF547 domain-containing protein [Planctomycetota bacterium]
MNHHLLRSTAIGFLPILGLLTLTTLLGCQDQTGSLSSGQGPSSRPSSRPAPKTKRLPDTKGFDALLHRIVKKGKVDYASLQKDHKQLDAFLESLSKANLEGASKEEQLVFWINAYNAGCLKLVLDHILGRGPMGRDLEGVLKVAGFFKKREIKVAGSLLSLDAIETNGRKLGDPRIHFAVNCASVSCPPIREAAWVVDGLDEALTRATERYLASPQGLQITKDGVRISKIFQWYQKDFGGLKGVRAFLMRYAPKAAKEKLAGSIDWLEYDWSLNRWSK